MSAAPRWVFLLGAPGTLLALRRRRRGCAPRFRPGADAVQHFRSSAPRSRIGWPGPARPILTGGLCGGDGVYTGEAGSCAAAASRLAARAAATGQSTRRRRRLETVKGDSYRLTHVLFLDCRTVWAARWPYESPGCKRPSRAEITPPQTGGHDPAWQMPSGLRFVGSATPPRPDGGHAAGTPTSAVVTMPPSRRHRPGSHLGPCGRSLPPGRAHRPRCR
jgi:hypothetical protein